MHFTLTGRHIEITESMRQYAQEKSVKLARFYDRLESIDVILDREPTKFRIEMVARADHRHTFVAQVDADDFYETVDLVTDKLEAQLRRHKEKVRNRKHAGKGEEDAAAEGQEP